MSDCGSSGDEAVKETSSACFVFVTYSEQWFLLLIPDRMSRQKPTIWQTDVCAMHSVSPPYPPSVIYELSTLNVKPLHLSSLSQKLASTHQQGDA